MRNVTKVLLACGAMAAVVAPTPAHAQIDVNPPLPNVLLLIDTSGSMEYLAATDASGNNQLPGAVAGTACTAGIPPTTPNRWASLVSVLTGTINNFSCQSTPRDATFSSEYSFGGAAPYDYRYYLPFNRLLSNNCTIGPGTAPVNYWDWPATAFKQHDISGVNVPCTTPWSQQTDGILDTFRDRVRFGLMTFDSFPDPSTGVTGSAPDGPGGMKGMWSYYPGWTAGSGGSKTGHPPGCAINLPYEVGARNQAAPPWEGRLIPFGQPDATLAQVQGTNANIQSALIAMRPYGATPVAGMFDDAREFLLNDASLDPATGIGFGPKSDSFYTGGCRKTFIILLSDGEPNQDMMPFCAKVGGACPYSPADTIAGQLATIAGTNLAIQTYVIGFGVSNPAALGPLGLTSCTQLNPALNCSPPKAGLEACCALSKIALAGGTKNAYFADDLVSLKAQLSTVLSGIASGSTARTVPTFSTISSVVAQGNANATGYRFVGQFTADPTGALWSGDLKRQRFGCHIVNMKTTPYIQDIVKLKGDDFASNINTGSAPARAFFSFIAPKVGGVINSTQTVRPSIVNDDGLGTYAKGGSAMTPSDGATFATAMGAAPEALGLNSVAPPAPCTTTLASATTGSCVTKLVNWEIGIPNAGLPTRASVLGSIYHSTPVAIGPPTEAIRDSSYTTFQVQAALRPIMLYTATTDGQLHAFKVAASDPADPNPATTNVNNEVWSFFPPTVLPKLLSSYNQQAILLDGAPVVSDIVYARTRGAVVTWNTVVVAGGGGAGGFYYALDVTDPTKPKFLWQLATDSLGSPLFGATSGTPAIATVTIPDPSGMDVQEVAVAILPGGSTALQAGTFTRDTSSSLMGASGFTPRTSVRNWAPGPGRSISIARLDTGEVLMNFRATAAEGPSGMTTNRQIVPFSSPLTGIPVPFPSQTGQVADRVYIGDADGNLWRLNLAGSNPANWSASLAWDAYPTSTVSGGGAQVGEQVQTTPVISTSPLGDTVIAYSTGDQQLFAPNATMDARLWSLTEKRNGVTNKFELFNNWYKSFIGGERVTGSMGLFDSVLYFSSFAPAPTSGGAACSFGSSSIWAVDYLTMAPKFPNPVQPASPKLFEVAPNTIVFGVAVTKTPSCFDTASTSDPYYGSSSSAANVNGGGYQAVWQIPAKGTGVTTNSAVTTDAFTNIQALQLPPLQQQTRIQSWASITE